MEKGMKRKKENTWERNKEKRKWRRKMKKK